MALLDLQGLELATDSELAANSEQEPGSELSLLICT